MFENLTVEDCTFLVLMTVAAMSVLVALFHLIWCICRCQRRRKRVTDFPVIVTAESKTPEELSSHMDVSQICPRGAEAAVAHTQDRTEMPEVIRTPKQNTPISGKTDASDTAFVYKGIKFPPIIRFETKSIEYRGNLETSFSKEGQSEESIGEPPGINLTDHDIIGGENSATNSLSDEVFGSVKSDVDDGNHEYDVIPILPPRRKSVHGLQRLKISEWSDTEDGMIHEGAGLLQGDITNTAGVRQRIQTLDAMGNLYESYQNGYVMPPDKRSEPVLDTSKDTSSNQSIEDGERLENDLLYDVPKSYYPDYMNYRGSIALMGTLKKNAQANMGMFTAYPVASESEFNADEISKSPTNKGKLQDNLQRTFVTSTNPLKTDPDDTVDQLICSPISNSGLTVAPDISAQNIGGRKMNQKKRGLSSSGFKPDPDNYALPYLSELKLRSLGSGQTNISELKVDPKISGQTNTSGLKVDQRTRSQTRARGVSVVEGSSEQTNTDEPDAYSDNSCQINGSETSIVEGRREINISNPVVMRNQTGLGNSQNQIVTDNSDGYVTKDFVNSCIPSVCQGAVATDKKGYIIMSGTVHRNVGETDVDDNQSMAPQTLSEIQKEILARYYIDPKSETQPPAESTKLTYEDVGYDGGYVNWKGTQSSRRVTQAEQITDMTDLEGSPSSRKS